MKVLVVAAHPDDEVLGVGGTLLKHRKEGDEIYICMVTKAYEPQWPAGYQKQKVAEQKKVDEILGTRKRFNLDYPTVKLNSIPHGELNRKITDIVEQVTPDIIYTHFEGDLNSDHSIVFRACMVATRPPRKTKLVCFETLSETEWGKSLFKPNMWVDIKDFIEKKIEVFNVYKSEVRKHPHPRSPEGIRLLGGMRGAEICREYAEAFIIIRSYW